MKIRTKPPCYRFLCGKSMRHSTHWTFSEVYKHAQDQQCLVSNPPTPPLPPWGQAQGQLQSGRWILSFWHGSHTARNPLSNPQRNGPNGKTTCFVLRKKGITQTHWCRKKKRKKNQTPQPCVGESFVWVNQPCLISPEAQGNDRWIEKARFSNRKTLKGEYAMYWV